MRILTDMDALPALREPVVTVGSFDGVHRGHLYLLDILRERAVLTGGETVVVTFGEHPRRVLHAEEGMRLLTPTDRKAALLDAAGIDNLVVMPFTMETSHLSPEEFVRDFLVGRIGVKELVVGYNHRFGRGREGDASVLYELGGKYGFRIYEAARFGGDGSSPGCEKISSTAIREALSRGDVEAAERILGRSLGAGL